MTMAPPSDDNYDRIGRSKTLTNNAEPPSATNPKYTLQGYKTAFRVVANDARLALIQHLAG